MWLRWYFNFSYPADSFKLVDKFTTSPGRFSGGFTLSEKDDLFRQGEASIRENIKDLGIVTTAEDNTRKLIEKLLTSSGYEVYITFKKSETLKTDQDEVAKDYDK